MPFGVGGFPENIIPEDVMPGDIIAHTNLEAVATRFPKGGLSQGQA